VSRRLTIKGDVKTGQVIEAVKALQADQVVLVTSAGSALVLSKHAAALRRLGSREAHLLITDRSALNTRWQNPSQEARKLADAFMPGALTLRVPTAAGNQDVMMPDDNLLRNLASRFPETLAFLEVLDCDTHQELDDAYGHQVDIWLDSGPARTQPSTLVDVTAAHAVVLRKGRVPILDLDRVLDRKVRLGPGVYFAVLFVCTGNTCRSALAKALLEQRLKDDPAMVFSAGTANLSGMPASEGAQAVAKEHGADLSRHSSTGLTRIQIADADLVLVMEPGHKRQVLEMSPEAASRTFTLTEYALRFELSEIPDPVGASLEVFRKVGKIIAECLDQVVADVLARQVEV